MTHSHIGRRKMQLLACAAAIVGATLLLAARAGGQTPDRSRVPVAPPAAPFKFPKSTTQTLPNGLRVIVVEEHALPLVTVRAVVGVDSLYDPAGKEGLFALTSAMLLDGTQSMSADQLSSAFASLGNSVTPFKFTTISQNVDRSMALMADMLQHPAFPQVDLDRRKAALAATKQRFAELPATAPSEVFLTQLLGAQSATTRAYSPSQAAVSSLTRDDVQHFYDTYFHPSNTTVIVVGDVTPSAALAEVRKNFGGWAGGHAPAAAAPPPFVEHPTTIYLVDQPGAKQTQIVVGTVGPRLDSPDVAALDVMSYVLGTGTASRINQNLRERHSYMYSGRPLGITWRRIPALSIISGSVPVNPTKSDSALIEWIGELRGMRDHLPTPAEMSVARGLLIDILPGQVETVDLIANQLTQLVQRGLPLNYYDGYAARVARVTPEEVSAVAAKYLDPAHLLIVVGGDRKVLEPEMKALGLGPVVVP
ncbi:MAG TPA: pitrilysin family protein [Gemmatimonadaceae bacterium]|jgi:zinc protease